MILRVLIKNFLSFDNEVQFDMFPNLKRTTLYEHIYQGGDVPLLRQSVMYGANGSGKSNFVKAMEFLRAFAMEKSFVKSIDLSKYFYLLRADAGKSPIYLGVEFENRGKYMFYEIELEENCVLKEALYETFPKEGRIDLVYRRKKQQLEFSKGFEAEEGVKEAVTSLLAKNPMSSVLSLNREFPVIRDSRCGVAMHWFRACLEIIGVHSFIPQLINLLHENSDMMHFIEPLISRLDVGVRNVELVETDFDKWAKNNVVLASKLPKDIENMESLSVNSNSTPIFSINMEKGIRKVYQLLFDNMGKGNFVAKLDASAQSDGTLRALTLLPALYFASKQGKTVIVDEINCCLSSSMVKGLVEFFAKNESANGQLIFTTHDEPLLEEKDILRSDEIWFVDKIDGASIIYSHNDFKEHNTISVRRGYVEGRYGAKRDVNLVG